MRRTDEMIDRRTLAEARITQDEFDQLEWDRAVEKHTDAYDRDDLQADAFEHADAIVDALNAGDLAEVGRILKDARAKTAAIRAAFSMGVNV